MSVDAQKSIRVLLLRGDSQWVAQCIEYDFAVQGRSLKDAISAFKLGLTKQVFLDRQFKRQPFDGFPPAPRNYHEMYEDGIKIDADFVDGAPVGSCEEIVEDFLRELSSETRILA